VKLTTYIHLVWSLGMGGTIPLLRIYTFMVSTRALLLLRFLTVGISSPSCLYVAYYPINNVWISYSRVSRFSSTTLTASHHRYFRFFHNRIFKVSYKPQRHPASDTVDHYYHTKFNRKLLVVSDVMRERWSHVHGCHDIVSLLS
jgi:hypothetical protein